MLAMTWPASICATTAAAAAAASSIGRSLTFLACTDVSAEARCTLGVGGGAGVSTACMLRSMAHTTKRAALPPTGSSGSSRAMSVHPFGREVMCRNTPSVFLSSDWSSASGPSASAGSRSDATSPSSRRVRRCFRLAGLSSRCFAPSKRSMSSTSSSRHIASSIMMRAARAGSRSSGRSLASPSASARRCAAPPTSSSGFGRRMLLKGTRPSPSSCTYAIGACPVRSCGSTSRSCWGKNLHAAAAASWSAAAFTAAAEA
mmetsp:Transcript_20615/g.45159  ORF Transcript_20615/g.45159 Transcript_20615/m.45159 type:complete len:259 (+) Transcript_20615:157-933(+)